MPSVILSLLQLQGPLTYNSEPWPLTSGAHSRAGAGGWGGQTAEGPHLTFGTITLKQQTWPNPWAPLNFVIPEAGPEARPFSVALFCTPGCLGNSCFWPLASQSSKLRAVMRSQAGLFCSTGFEDKRGCEQQLWFLNLSPRTPSK